MREGRLDLLMSSALAFSRRLSILRLLRDSRRDISLRHWRSFATSRSILGVKDALEEFGTKSWRECCRSMIS